MHCTNAPTLQRSIRIAEEIAFRLTNRVHTSKLKIYSYSRSHWRESKPTLFFLYRSPNPHPLSPLTFCELFIIDLSKSGKEKRRQRKMAARKIKRREKWTACGRHASETQTGDSLLPRQKNEREEKFATFLRMLITSK